MKITHFFILILLTFTMLSFVPDSFAQDDSPKYLVRLVYFLPNDRQSQPDMDAKMDALIKDVQQFYKEQMDNHGFGRKTFRLETDENDQAVVHHVDGQFTDSYYHEGTFSKVSKEIRERFDTSQNIYLVVVNISTEKIGNSAGEAINDGYWGGIAAIPASGPSFNHPLAAHEIGHTFGLGHDFSDSFRIMSYGPWPWDSGATELSKCAAEWLSVHRFFNTNRNQTDFDDPAKIQMLTPSLTPPPYAIRLRFEITDSDGLHQAQLFAPLAPYYNSGPSLTACKRLEGKSSTVEFVAADLTTELNSYVILSVIDVHGNFTSKRYTIDVTSVLPSPTDVTIPDANLAAAVRETLNLPLGKTVTQLDMLRLTTLGCGDQQIKDITGLEHATNLKVLNLYQNEIRDITPLAELTQLRSLDLAINYIRDITPLAKLTQLRFLSLYSDYLLSNQIRDITPLAKLTQLRVLWIAQNQIRDITPLAKLTQLRTLDIPYNQISDITPLAKLTQLTYLDLSNNQISSAKPLSELTQLRILRLSNNQISDINPLTALIQLKELSLRWNQISNLTPLAGLVNLWELRLIRNPIKDVTPLHSLLDQNPNIGIDIHVGYVPTSSDPAAAWMPDPRLRLAIRGALKLSLDDPITQQAMQNISVLENYNTLIKDLTGLEHATQLKELSIHNNHIRDITPLSKLTKLTVINAAHNEIEDISLLKNLRNLKHLNLAGNQISDIAPLEGLTKLKKLHLWSNKIEDVSPISGLINLEELSINFNKISDIAPLKKLTKLKVLYLSYNRIKDVSPLSGLINLETLYLVSNPITNRNPLSDLLKKNPDIKVYLKDRDTPLPVNLSHFRAEHTNAGVILKWTTESEVDNAGFYIYRSETKGGEFKVVNPKLIQGAGTTAERTDYTWTDSTAKPNTVYYYRIEDVSHAGVREQLATVRLRGFVSASGKMTTRWSDLKMLQ